MRSVDTDSLLANIPLEEIANICCKTLFKNTRRVQVILKITFKEKFSRAINGSYSIFHWKLYKQGDGVAMGSLFGPTFASLFLVYFGKNRLQNCPTEFMAYYYWRHVDDIFFYSPHQNI